MKKAALALSIIALTISALNLALNVLTLLDKKYYLNVENNY